MRVEVRGVGGEHDWAASRLDPHALQTLRVAADMVDGDSRRDLVLAVVKGDASVKHFAHHRHHVVDLERQPQRHVAHAAARCICHLAILQVIARPRKQIVVADVIVMHVADDDRLHLRRLDADCLQPDWKERKMGPDQPEQRGVKQRKPRRESLCRRLPSRRG